MSDPNLNPNLPAVAGGPGTAVSAQMPSDSDDSFIAEFAVMDLEPLRDHTYFVSVNTGDRNKCKFLSSTIRGPYAFLEMVQEVGFMWEEHLHHAKAIIAEKNRMKPVRYLDQKTVDYIEAHYREIVADAFLEEVLGKKDDKFTHVAGIIEGKIEDDPIMVNAKTIADNKAKAEADLGKKQDNEDEDL
jgi:hypothetical protein